MFLFLFYLFLYSGQDVIRAHLFVNDFVLTQLIGKDINEIWCVENPMGLLVEELKKQGSTSLPVSRLDGFFNICSIVWFLVKYKNSYLDASNCEDYCGRQVPRMQRALLWLESMLTRSSCRRGVEKRWISRKRWQLGMLSDASMALARRQRLFPMEIRRGSSAQLSIAFIKI